MKRFLIGLIGLAAFGASSLIGQTLAYGGESCCAEAACCPEAGCNGGYNGGCKDCSRYCPRCGCRLEPVCNPTCETKKETVHKYCCKCKDLCIPGVTPCGCHGGECCDNNGACNGGCATGCDPCEKGCGDCRCRVIEVHKLMVCPVTKEHCVRGCTVTWACPKCGDCCGGCDALPPTNAVPAAPGKAAPAPAPAPNSNTAPPPPKVTSTSAIEEVGTAQAGF